VLYAIILQLTDDQLHLNHDQQPSIWGSTDTKPSTSTVVKFVGSSHATRRARVNNRNGMSGKAALYVFRLLTYWRGILTDQDLYQRVEEGYCVVTFFATPFTCKAFLNSSEWQPFWEGAPLRLLHPFDSGQESVVYRTSNREVRSCTIPPHGWLCISPKGESAGLQRMK